MPISSTRSLAHLRPSQLATSFGVVALAAPDASVHPLAIQSLAVRAARGERIGVLVGHNRFDLYSLARQAREHGFDPGRVLANIELSRAFTCHQMHHRILTLGPEHTRRWSALYVLGLLDTFYDESVPAHEAERLLNESLVKLGQIAHDELPVLVTCSHPKEPGRERFTRAVARRADEYWELTADVPQLTAPRQLELF